MLTKDQRKRVEIPHEPGAWMVLRPLPWPLLEAAASERTRRQTAAATELMSSIMSAEERREAMAAAQAQNRQDGVQAPTAPPDPADVWDRRIVLRAGIVEWSYGDPFDPDLIDDLDEQTADWAFRTILAPAVKAEEERLSSLVPFPTTLTE